MYTIPEFFGKRFCSKSILKLATVVSTITMIVYLLSVVQGIGTLAHTVTNIDYKICITLALVVFVIVSITSGSSGVLITDTIMFGVFTIALVISTFVITGRAGGWFSVVEQLSSFERPDLLSWSGNLTYLYQNGWSNVLWGIVYGIVWMSVCMVGPWQSSRYLMAKNEHTVVRSSLYTAFGIFLLELLVGMSAVTVNVFRPDMESSSQVLIWASTHILPEFLGVILLTGILAAGISSATTFLSLIGSSFANDIYKEHGDSIKVGKIAMVIVALIVLVLALTNPPQIFWILYLGGSIIASSWMPVAIASIISKKVTKYGAFFGMFSGFAVCFLIKIVTNIYKITLPVYLDATIVGIMVNVVVMGVVSYFTNVSEEEINAREMLFVIPAKENRQSEVKVTMKYLKAMVALGAVITIVLIVVWAMPVMKSRL